MSGPLRAEDVAFEKNDAVTQRGSIEITDSRVAEVGNLTVKRVLPQRTRRTVGAWCFADHMGPANFGQGDGPQVGPHPHMGLQTVTWLISGELVHLDSLGSEQPIRPGQLNLMTAGRGVAHAEEAAGFGGDFHGVQLWVAQPSSTRNSDPAFEHHSELPRVELSGVTATVLVGEFAGARSSARRDSDHLGVELDVHDATTLLPLKTAYEYALVVLSGILELGDRELEPGRLAYIGTGHDEIALRSPVRTRAMLLGGLPFEESITMWWNFVARDHQEMNDAFLHWSNDDGWFGQVQSRLNRAEAVPPPWLTSPSS